MRRRESAWVERFSSISRPGWRIRNGSRSRSSWRPLRSIRASRSSSGPQRKPFASACPGRLERLFQQFADGGGELWLCPICLNARKLADAEKVGNAKVAGATPMWEWAGDDTTVFSY
jgi:hypothetical protein